MIRLFCGYDEREAVGMMVFLRSLLEHTKEQVTIVPLAGRTDGTNAFTLARFLVPYFCKFEGHAIWLDGSDMLLRTDLGELWERALFLDSAVGVVQHDYEPRFKVKYVGTELEAPQEAYPRKNWSSLILWNCSHYSNRGLTKSFVQSQSGRYLHRFAWLEDEQIGEVPAEWNWLDEFGPNDYAKLIHYTNGIPGFAHYAGAPHAEEWKDALRKAQRGLF